MYQRWLMGGNYIGVYHILSLFASFLTWDCSWNILADNHPLLRCSLIFGCTLSWHTFHHIPLIGNFLHFRKSNPVMETVKGKRKKEKSNPNLKIPITQIFSHCWSIWFTLVPQTAVAIGSLIFPKTYRSRNSCPLSFNITLINIGQLKAP